MTKKISHVDLFNPLTQNCNSVILQTLKYMRDCYARVEKGRKSVYGIARKLQKNCSCTYVPNSCEKNYMPKYCWKL